VRSVLLITPPMVQFNTAYPAVPMLAASLQRHGHHVVQADLSLALALRLFSPEGVGEVARALGRGFSAQRGPDSVRDFLANQQAIAAALPRVVALLQGAPMPSEDLAGFDALPAGSRFLATQGLWTDDDPGARARHHASLFLDEIADAVREGLDPRFELARYAEHLASAGDFPALAKALRRRPTLIDRWIDQQAESTWRLHRPAVVGFSVPFPGALYAAFRLARRMKALDGNLITVLGGGYVNTELRELSEPRVFDDFDFVTYDDGEIPLLRIVEHVIRHRPLARLVRTRRRQRGRVTWHDDPEAPVLRHRDRAAPDLTPVRTAGYLAMSESPNPMHRLWSERRWLKLALAHGCYWHRCAFCDTSLDYIRRFDPADAETIVGWMETLMAQTGLSDFHFVDEAAPPALLGAVARMILARGLKVSWWTNIRFDRAFTPALTELLARSGCVAVSGGLECASDGLLALQCKGFDTAQATHAMAACARAGLLVHAYLMYGYPTQTVQQTVDALDLVRQLFAAGIVHSAYWHRFALTVHSPAFHQADALRIRIHPPQPTGFACNEVAFHEDTDLDPSVMAPGLRKAVYNYMHGFGVRAALRTWFDFPVPRSRLGRDFVRQILVKSGRV
jgi:hypothetical protein